MSGVACQWADCIEIRVIVHVQGVAFYPNSERIVTGGWDGLLMLWDLHVDESTGVVTCSADPRVLRGHSEQVSVVDVR